MLLLANSGDYDDGYQDLMQIEYGSADVFAMLQEGCYATVYYHDEAYGDVTDIDENALATASVASGFTSLSAQSDDDDLNDSATTPGYIEEGDEHGELYYGNEVIHVANVIVGTNQPYDDVPTGIDDGTTPTPSPAPNPSDPGASEASGAEATKPSSQSTSSTVAKTGDPLVGLGGLLSAAAVVGTAFAAYSARRVANEKGNSEEE